VEAGIRLGETNGVELPSGPGGGFDVRWNRTPPGPGIVMEALFTSTAIVALAEIGDKTQLLAILLAARFGRPLPIILGILAATLANHALAALLGAQAAAFLDGPVFRCAIGISFIAMAAWTLVPDTFDDEDAPRPRFSAFLTTLVAFFLVEMGDKTQVATIALGAQYQAVALVTAGTTLGMMIANVPAIFLGNELLRRVDIGRIRLVAAALFLAIGIWVLVQTAGWLGS
jgi:putative Ca2+/H+ antiporter (TMEM165/GDT1 family)